MHISIHYPRNVREVQRVRAQVTRLSERGIRCGVNLLVEKEHLSHARNAVSMLQEAGIGLDRIVLLSLRSVSDPAKLRTARDILEAAGGSAFQSMTCLTACGKSPRFCAISWDKKVAWCSYTVARRSLETLDARGLHRALDGLGLVYCGAKAREEMV